MSACAHRCVCWCCVTPDHGASNDDGRTCVPLLGLDLLQHGRGARACMTESMQPHGPEFE